MSLTYSPEFLAFWSAYPRQTHKWAAFLAWKAATKRFGQDAVLFGLKKAKRQEWRGREMKYIPHAASFLRATDFDDEYEGVDDELPRTLPLFPALPHWCTVCTPPHQHDCGKHPNCGLGKDVACAAFVHSMRIRA